MPKLEIYLALLRQLESEVKALRTLRSQNIDRFIAVAREELTALCGECYVEPVEATGEGELWACN